MITLGRLEDATPENYNRDFSKPLGDVLRGSTGVVERTLQVGHDLAANVLNMADEVAFRFTGDQRARDNIERRSQNIRQWNAELNLYDRGVASGVGQVFNQIAPDLLLGVGTAIGGAAVGAGAIAATAASGAALGANQFTRAREELVNLQGVSEADADVAAGLSGLLTGVSAFLPASLGKTFITGATSKAVMAAQSKTAALAAISNVKPLNLTTAVATGAGINAASGVVERGSVSGYLKSKGYDEAAEAYDAFDGYGLAMDAVFGGIFGGFSRYRPRTADDVLTREAQDYFTTLPEDYTPAELADIADAQLDVMKYTETPAPPKNRDAFEYNARAVELASQQVVRGDPVDVSSIIRPEDADNLFDYFGVPETRIKPEAIDVPDLPMIDPPPRNVELAEGETPAITLENIVNGKVRSHLFEGYETSVRQVLSIIARNPDYRIDVEIDNGDGTTSTVKMKASDYIVQQEQEIAELNAQEAQDGLESAIRCMIQTGSL